MNRLTGFFGGGKKSTNEDGMGPEKTDMAVGGELWGRRLRRRRHVRAARRRRAARPGRDAGRAPARRRRRAAARARAAGHREAHRGLLRHVFAEEARLHSLSGRARLHPHRRGVRTPSSEFVLGRSTKKAQRRACSGQLSQALRASRRLSSGASVPCAPPAFVARALRGRRGGLGAPELAAAAALRAHAEARAARRREALVEEVLRRVLLRWFRLLLRLLLLLRPWRSFMASSAPAKASTQPWSPNAALAEPLCRPAANWASTVASAPKPTLSPRFLCSMCLSAPCSFLPRPLPSDQPMDAMSLRDTAL